MQADPELEAIRQRRMQELMAQRGAVRNCFVFFDEFSSLLEFLCICVCARSVIYRAYDVLLTECHLKPGKSAES